MPTLPHFQGTTTLRARLGVGDFAVNLDASSSVTSQLRRQRQSSVARDTCVLGLVCRQNFQGEQRSISKIALTGAGNAIRWATAKFGGGGPTQSEIQNLHSLIVEERHHKSGTESGTRNTAMKAKRFHAIPEEKRNVRAIY